MESECSNGDGLTFYFRSQRCVPEDMYMYATQPTICLANWNEGIYTFSIIRHNIFNYMWLLRIPTIRQKVFTTYLFKDLFADTANIVSETYRYLRIDTIQDDPYDLTTLCRDDYEICTTVRAPCTSTLSHLSITCPLTCGICDSIRPVLCSLNPEWIGSWSDHGTHKNVTKDVNITSTTITVSSSVKGKKNYRCVRWTSPTGATVSTSTDSMFVTEYSNGCRPRYTCVRVLKQSSSLLYLELSKHMTWPLIKSSNDTVNCEGASFRSSDQHLLLHANHRSEEPVQCRIPTEALKTFQVRLRNGMVCHGNMSETKEGTGFAMHLNGCQSEPLIERSFLCLESSMVGSTSHRLVITKANQLLYCWLFLKQQSSTMYLLDALHCQLGLRPNVRLELSQIILQGVLANKIHKSSIAAGEERSFSSRRQLNKTSSSEINKSEKQITKQPVEVLIQPSTAQEEAFYPSPVAIVFAAIFYAILQTVMSWKC